MAEERTDVVVIGGGLAGLTAAVTAARAGRTAVVLDGRTDLGGRARSEVHEGFTFNQGAHALYRAGRGREVLRSLGVRPTGSMPRVRGSRLSRGGKVHPLVSSGGVSTAGWAAIGRFLGPGATRRAEGLTAAEWIASCPNSSARDGLTALTHVSTYLADLDHADAVEILRQLRRAERGVDYLDGGWQSLVVGLADAASAAGVRVLPGAKVEALESTPGGVRVTFRDGSIVGSAAVIASGGPRHAAQLVGESSPTVTRWAEDARPVIAACLDIALHRLPSPRRGVVLGIDEPTYLNLHTPAAKLAPASGGELLCLMRYSADGDPGGDHRALLEALAESVYPGWRDEVAYTQFGRHLVVAHDRPRPHVPPADRPAIVCPELPGVFFAGDWITTEGMLADAALSSGAAAGAAAAAVEPVGVSSVAVR